MTICLNDEKWKTLEHLPKTLLISNCGRIKSHNKILIGETMRNGYIRIHIRINGESKHLSVHRLVAEAFIPNPENKPQVNHIDGNKRNNRVENLEWCTPGENLKHAYKAKLKSAKGTKNGQNKLSEEEVREIKNRYIKGKHGMNNSNSLAKEFNVSPRTILNIVKGRTWNYLFEE